MDYYKDPDFAGWRGHMARAARKNAAHKARSRRMDARARRIMAARVAAAIAARGGR